MEIATNICMVLAFIAGCAIISSMIVAIIIIAANSGSIVTMLKRIDDKLKTTEGSDGK